MTTINDMEDLHQQALQQGLYTYKDPATGFTVFTELAHQKRGVCCGSQCRHCPYDWQNVKTRRPETILVVVQPKQKQKPTGGRLGGKLTTKNVPYTRGGDKGTSQLLTGERRSKMDDAFEAMGTVDELCSTTGVVHAQLQSSNIPYGDLPEWLLEVMSRLFDIGSHVAKPPKKYDAIDNTNNNNHHDDDDDDDDDIDAPTFIADGIGGGFDASHIQQLEDWIDIMTEELPELSSFVLPTGGMAAAQLHICRTVCRRAERRVVGLGSHVCDPHAMTYLNRLSDFFFTAARYTNQQEGHEEILYRRAQRGDTQRQRQRQPQQSQQKQQTPVTLQHEK